MRKKDQTPRVIRPEPAKKKKGLDEVKITLIRLHHQKVLTPTTLI